MLENPRVHHLRVGKRLAIAESRCRWKDFKLVEEKKDARNVSSVKCCF